MRRTMVMMVLLDQPIWTIRIFTNSIRVRDFSHSSSMMGHSAWVTDKRFSINIFLLTDYFCNPIITR